MELEEGDVVTFDRGSIRHQALYIGERQVIHLWAPMDGGIFKVRIDPIALVHEAHDDPQRRCSMRRSTSEFDAVMKQVGASTPFTHDEVVRRARSRLGNSRYQLVTHNCEHFVTWARYGVGYSSQARTHVRLGATAFLVLSVAMSAVGGVSRRDTRTTSASVERLPVFTDGEWSLTLFTMLE